MKIQVASDLHFRSSDSNLEDYLTPSADILVLAGDVMPIACGYSAVWKQLLDSFEHVVFVAGNHEFYGSSLDAIYDLRYAYRYDSRMHILTDESVTLNGIKFFGGTMWADINPMEEYEIKRCLNDFRLIKGLTINKVDILYRSFHKSLEMQQDVDVVVTHFGPSTNSTHKKYASSCLNSYFCSDFLNNNTVKANLWIHGHVHDSFDYKINNTRVLCNPKGYGYENSTGYKKDLTIEVGYEHK